MTPQEITEDLSNFTGTESYHRFNPLTPHVVASDGAARMAELCGAWWLLDVIASHTPAIPKDEGFAIALFQKGNPHIFTLTDDLPANTVYAKQHIGYSDFPLEEMKLFVGRQDDLLVIHLPSEY